MQFIDLAAQYAALKSKIDLKIGEVLESSVFILGSEVSSFEKEISEYVGRGYCAGCGNGTDALSLALTALGIGPGDAVFVPAFTFFATAETVSKCGAQPVFVDIDIDTFNMSASSLSEKIEYVLKDGRFSPKAVIAVDLFGLPADYINIGHIAGKYGLKIIEDGAQGFGGTIEGKRACSFGDISTTSFFPAKPLGCYGDGGAVFTDDPEMDSLLKSLRFHGKGSDKYDNIRIGFNSRLDNIQAGILRIKLEAFADYELCNRHKIASAYDSALKGLCKTPCIPENSSSSYAQYTLTLSDSAERDGLKEFLKSNGIPSMVYYPRCMHELRVYADYPLSVDGLSNAERAAKTVLSIPMHPYLSMEQVDEVSGAVREFFVGRQK